MAESVIRHGNHLWARCEDCGKLVKLTGWLRGIHLCLTDKEIAAKRRGQIGSGNPSSDAERADPTSRSGAKE